MNRAFLRMRLMHLVYRIQMLALCHNQSQPVFLQPEPIVEYLLLNALTEYRERDNWEWSSYANAFGLLRMEEAGMAFTMIATVRASISQEDLQPSHDTQELSKHKLPEHSATRDHLRRLLSHTMISSRLTPSYLDLDISRLTFHHVMRPLTTNEPAEHVETGSYGVIYYATYQDPKTAFGEEVASKSLRISGKRTERVRDLISSCFWYSNTSPESIP